MVCFKISIYQSTELKLCGLLLTVFCYFVNIFFNDAKCYFYELKLSRLVLFKKNISLN